MRHCSVHGFDDSHQEEFLVLVQCLRCLRLLCSVRFALRLEQLNFPYQLLHLPLPATMVATDDEPGQGCNQQDEQGGNDDGATMSLTHFSVLLLQLVVAELGIVARQSIGCGVRVERVLQQVEEVQLQLRRVGIQRPIALVKSFVRVYLVVEVAHLREEAGCLAIVRDGFLLPLLAEQRHAQAVQGNGIGMVVAHRLHLWHNLTVDVLSLLVSMQAEQGRTLL